MTDTSVPTMRAMTCGGPEVLALIGTAAARNHDRLRELGAEPVTYGDGVVERVRALAPEGVDAVADFVGGVLDVTTAVLADDGGTRPSPRVRSPRRAATTCGSARTGPRSLTAGKITVQVSTD